MGNTDVYIKCLCIASKQATLNANVQPTTAVSFGLDEMAPTTQRGLNRGGASLRSSRVQDDQVCDTASMSILEFLGESFRLCTA